MSNIVNTSPIELALIKGDLSLLNPDQRLSYYKSVCDSLGLNSLTKPFEYIELNRKLVLYATRSCTDQLRKVNSVSITVKSRELIGSIYVVTANGKDSNGREDESTGAVNIEGLKGEALANAYMKAETKAKRRVTLSLCGLGMLDESEVETISDAKKPEAVQQVSAPKVVEAQESSQADYIFTFGKYKGMKVSECNAQDLVSYVNYIKAQSSSQGKAINGKVAEALDAIEQHIKSLDQFEPDFQVSEEFA
jgi:hypothetical protein